MAPTLYDMHCHLDFFRDCADVARAAREMGLAVFANTVTPDGILQAKQVLCNEPNVRVGVGLHPWWVADGRCGPQDVERATELVRGARFVGEVGLDLSPRHVPAGSKDAQVSAFETVTRSCAETSDTNAPKVLSIHAVRSAGLALDVLESTGCLSTCHCIFHWFSGTSDELHRAVRAGCWFSVNEMMLRTRRGREYARQLPVRQLLLETDMPPGEDVPCPADEIVASLERTAGQLGVIRGADIRGATSENAEMLLS